MSCRERHPEPKTSVLIPFAVIFGVRRNGSHRKGVAKGRCLSLLMVQQKQHRAIESMSFQVSSTQILNFHHPIVKVEPLLSRLKEHTITRIQCTPQKVVERCRFANASCAQQQDSLNAI